MVFEQSGKCTITWCHFISIPVVFLKYRSEMVFNATATRNNPTSLDYMSDELTCDWTSVTEPETQSPGWNTQSWFVYGQHMKYYNDRPTNATGSLQWSVYRRRNVLRDPNQSDLWNVSVFFSNKHTVDVSEARERGMHVYVDYCVHSQKDEKQQEWKRNSRRQVLICAAPIQTAIRIYP